MIARQVLYTGRVQGVGFRYTAKSLAAGFCVTGWVKNLPDGRVELQANAADVDEMNEFLEAIDDELGGFIREKELHIIQPLTGVTGFSIAK